MQERNDTRERCAWCGTDPLYVAYHDEEWGVPADDDRHLFGMLILEGQQAGLSWLTILKKRDAFREVFAGFDPERVAALKDDGVPRSDHRFFVFGRDGRPCRDCGATILRRDVAGRRLYHCPRCQR